MYTPIMPGDYNGSQNAGGHPDKSTEALHRKMLRDNIRRNTDAYILQQGEPAIRAMLEQFKKYQQTYQQITGSTFRIQALSLEAMLFIVGLVPQECGYDIGERPQLKDLLVKLQAMKVLMERDVAAIVKKGSPLGDL